MLRALLEAAAGMSSTSFASEKIKVTIMIAEGGMGENEACGTALRVDVDAASPADVILTSRHLSSRRRPLTASINGVHGGDLAPR